MAGRRSRNRLTTFLLPHDSGFSGVQKLQQALANANLIHTADERCDHRVAIAWKPGGVSGPGPPGRFGTAEALLRALR